MTEPPIHCPFCGETRVNDLLRALKAIEPYLSIVESHGGHGVVKLIDEVLATADTNPSPSREGEGGKMEESGPNKTMLVALQAIEDMIGDAINQKIRTGRMPPIGGLLSMIQDTATAAIFEAKQSAKKA